MKKVKEKRKKEQRNNLNFFRWLSWFFLGQKGSIDKIPKALFALFGSGMIKDYKLSIWWMGKIKHYI